MFIVTLDGPMASGKTSVSRVLAKKIRWKWLSTGAFYRGLAYIARSTYMNIEDEDSIAQLISSSSWKVDMLEDSTSFLYQGQDITEEIYDEEVGQISSYLSRYPKVREKLTQIQRDFVKKADSQGVLVEGRDCGTVLFPEAHLKFYITAFRDKRIERRILDEKRRRERKISLNKESSAKENSGSSMQKTKQQEIIDEKLFYYRDIQDSSRSVAPFTIPRQAYFVNTSEMSLDEVVTYVHRIVSKHCHLDEIKV